MLATQDLDITSSLERTIPSIETISSSLVQTIPHDVVGEVIHVGEDDSGEGTVVITEVFVEPHPTDLVFHADLPC